jgi:hypothetical protein
MYDKGKANELTCVLGQGTRDDHDRRPDELIVHGPSDGNWNIQSIHTPHGVKRTRSVCNRYRCDPAGLHPLSLT